jgi:hypothetical protein
MTQQHPITPPPELMSKWCYEDGEEIKSSPRWFFSVCAKAAQWGADQELEACLRLVEIDAGEDAYDFARYIRAARRPKPPSLKEQALAALDDAIMRGDCITISDALPTIRRALEQLND